MTGLLLTKSFSSAEPKDDAEIYAFALERGMRELRWRLAAKPAVLEVTLAEMVPARDAGDVCGVCGELVTWVDHLPPVKSGEAVRCFKNVRYPAFESFGYAVNDPKHPDYHDTYADASDMREDF